MPEHKEQPVDTENIRELLRQKKSRMKLCLAACAGCSLCADSCFLFRGHDKDPRYMPSYKVYICFAALAIVCWGCDKEEGGG